MKRGEKEDIPRSQQTFTLRNTVADVRHTIVEPSKLIRADSVFEPNQAKKSNESEKSTKSIKSLIKKPNLTKRKNSEKKKKGNELIDSEECLRIEFAELLAEPENKYIPSLHGWRYWGQNSEWIDPDGARQEAVQAVEERCKELPLKKYGPPLP